MQNITLTVPQGTLLFNHSDPHLVCRATRWTDIAAFFLGNYISHAATVKSRPGELVAVSLAMQYFALIFPTVGVGRGIEAIVAWTVYYNLRKRPLYAAARAGALCMVVRDNDWAPKPGLTHNVSYALLSKDDARTQQPFFRLRNQQSEEVIELQQSEEEIELQQADGARSKTVTIYDPVWAIPVILNNHDFLSFKTTSPKHLEFTHNIHGLVRLPAGYTITSVPSDAEVGSASDNDAEEGRPASPTFQVENIAYSWNFVKALVSVLQLLWSVASLYRARGNQIDMYGYAAFGLTVAPYTVMALVNLVSNLVSVTYPDLYLVETPIMQEAIERGGKFVGMVGSLHPSDLPSECGPYLKTCRLQSEADVDDEGVGCVIIEWENGSGTLNEVPRFEPRPGVFAVPTCPPFERRKSSRINDGFRRGMSLPAFLPDPSLWRKVANRDITPVSGQVIGFRLLTATGFCSAVAAMYLPAAASLAIVGGLSRFRAGNSTPTQRFWTMTWLSLGLLNPVATLFPTLARLKLPHVTRLARYIAPKILNGGSFAYNKVQRELPPDFIFLFIACYSVPAFYGFVVVGEMLKSYGVCLRAF